MFSWYEESAIKTVQYTTFCEFITKTKELIAPCFWKFH